MLGSHKFYFGNRLHSLEPFRAFRLCVCALANTRSHSRSIDLLNGWQARQRRLAYVNQLPSWNPHKRAAFSISGSNGFTFNVPIRIVVRQAVLNYLNWFAGVYEKTIMRQSHCQIIQFASDLFRKQHADISKFA